MVDKLNSIKIVEFDCWFCHFDKIAILGFNSADIQLCRPEFLAFQIFILGLQHFICHFYILGAAIIIIILHLDNT